LPELAVAVHVVTNVKHCLSVVSTPVSSVILSQDIAEDISVTVVSTSRSFVFCKARRVASFPAVFAAVASKPDRASSGGVSVGIDAMAAKVEEGVIVGPLEGIVLGSKLGTELGEELGTRLAATALGTRLGTKLGDSDSDSSVRTSDRASSPPILTAFETIAPPPIVFAKGKDDG